MVASVERLTATDTDTPSGTTEAGDPVSPQGYLQAAADIREAATQINKALGRLESDEMSNVVTSLGGLSRSTLAEDDQSVQAPGLDRDHESLGVIG